MQFLAHEEKPSADKFRPRDEYFIIIGFGPSANASAGGADEMGSPVTLIEGGTTLDREREARKQCMADQDPGLR